MTRLFDLKDLVGESGYVKLTWTKKCWALFVMTSEEETWAGNGEDLEALCLHCLDALDPEWAS